MNYSQSLTAIAITAGLAAAAAGAWWSRQAPDSSRTPDSYVLPEAAPAAARPAPAGDAPGSMARHSLPRAAAPVPPPVPMVEMPTALRALTTEVLDRLRGGPTAAACEGAQAAILGLLQQSRMDSSLWGWGMDRARDCLRAPTAFRAKNGLLSALIDRYPDHPRVRELSGLQQYDAGDMDAAAESLEDAAPETDTFEAWETYADAQLARARQLQAAGDPRWQDALVRAENAAMRALELANAFMRPFALHTVARTQIEMGRPAEAVQWADQAVEAVRAGGSRYQAVMTAEFYVFAGQIYYRAGQRDTGMAYMDQGIGMAPRADQQAQLRNIRDEFLRMYGSA
jgi:tetratricopeptide (TPR) repeat protein